MTHIFVALQNLTKEEAQIALKDYNSRNIFDYVFEEKENIDGTYSIVYHFGDVIVPHEIKDDKEK